MSAKFQISLPPWNRHRLIKEACAAYNLYREKDAPAADPESSDWTLLCNVIHSYLRHSHTNYDEALASGADRDSLRQRIGEAVARFYPWLRADRDLRLNAVESHDGDHRPFNNFSRRLSDLITERSRLTVAINQARRRQASGWREHVAELEEKLVRVNAHIERLTSFFQPAIEKTKDGVFVHSIGHIHMTPGYDFGGRGTLPENYTRSVGFKCPMCQKTVMRTKTGIDHGSGKRLAAFSCHCFSMSIENKAAFSINLRHWQKSVARNDMSTNIIVCDEDGVIYGFQLAADIREGRKKAKDVRIFRGAVFNAFYALLSVKYPEHAAVRAMREAATVTPEMLERISAEIELSVADIEMMLESQERFLAENP